MKNYSIEECLEEQMKINEQHRKLNGRLRNIIDKAIEYIEEEEWNTEYDNKLLKILYGEDNV